MPTERHINILKGKTLQTRHATLADSWPPAVQLSSFGHSRVLDMPHACWRCAVAQRKGGPFALDQHKIYSELTWDPCPPSVCNHARMMQGGVCQRSRRRMATCCTCPFLNLANARAVRITLLSCRRSYSLRVIFFKLLLCFIFRNLREPRASERWHDLTAAFSVTKCHLISTSTSLSDWMFTNTTLKTKIWLQPWPQWFDARVNDVSFQGIRHVQKMPGNTRKYPPPPMQVYSLR